MGLRSEVVGGFETVEWAQDDQGYSIGADTTPHLLYPETQRARRPDCDPNNKAVEARGDMQDDASPQWEGGSRRKSQGAEASPYCVNCSHGDRRLGV